MRVLEKIETAKAREVVLPILEGEKDYSTAKQIFYIAGKDTFGSWFYPYIGEAGKGVFG